MSERTEVQNPLLRYAAEIGWTYIAPDEVLTLRGGGTQAGRVGGVVSGDVGGVDEGEGEGEGIGVGADPCVGPGRTRGCAPTFCLFKVIPS